MKGNLLQTMVRNMNNFQLKVHYPNGIFSGILAMGDDIIVCGQNEYTRFTIYKWNGKKYDETRRCLMKSAGDTKKLTVAQMKKSTVIDR